MARLFLSHSSVNNPEATGLRDWLKAEGWDDVFVDFDPQRGIAAGDRWERALNQAVTRCEAVLFVVSRAWLDSRWCLREFDLAHRLNKRLFGILTEDLPLEDIPQDLANTWQLVRLGSGREKRTFRVKLPVTGDEAEVTFSAEGLIRLKNGLRRAGLDPRFFEWPPAGDPARAPYRGLRPLEADDAGIFFGRDAPTIQALDVLRGLRDAAAPRCLVILGASGAGKSSFLRAGLLPRLAREERSFVPLPVVRPERAVMHGKHGFLPAMQEALGALGVTPSKSELERVADNGGAALTPYLKALVDHAERVHDENEVQLRSPTLVLAVDQGEELFHAQAQGEAQQFLALLRDLLLAQEPSLIVVITIRSDSYERLQEAKQFESIRKTPFDLGPMPTGAYAEVIKGPAQRLDGSDRPLVIETGLVETLLRDIEVGGSRDALPLLSFTLERLYAQYHPEGRLRLAHYDQLGGIKGSIEAAVEQAFAAADLDEGIPKDRSARLAMLRRGLIPWLAGIDPDSGSPRRRVARLSEIPPESRPLIELLVEQRLLATDMSRTTGETTIEPVHEALLRQWGLLQGWLAEDFGLLTVMDGVKRAARDWAANGKDKAWLTHTTERLRAADRLQERADLAASLEPMDFAYLATCRDVAHATRRRLRLVRTFVAALVVGVIAIGWLGYGGWLDPDFIEGRINFIRNSMRESSLKPVEAFRECADCPDMMLVPAGKFVMGSTDVNKEQPPHEVVIRHAFLVSRFEITFAQWDVCTARGGCAYRPHDEGWGRGEQPVVNVSWTDVQQYLAWLSKVSGKQYRLLSEAEWEYAARAGGTSRYPWGDAVKHQGQSMANCADCGSRWDFKQTAPVGQFPANAFGLHDMVGNVSEWVEDIGHDSFTGAPADGTAWLQGGFPENRIVRGGSWFVPSEGMRSSNRGWVRTTDRGYGIGFRVARTLTPQAPRTANPTQTEATRPADALADTASRSGVALVLDGFKFYKQSGFSFRTAQVVGWDSVIGDLLVARHPVSKELSAFMPGIEGMVATDTIADVVRAGILEQPVSSFADIKTCPKEGYRHGYVEIRTGAFYCVIVRNGQSYAKIAVREIQQDGVKFEWVYNPAGGADF